jgi:hypothetical protein
MVISAQSEVQAAIPGEGTVMGMGNNLAELPRGVHFFEGVKFKIGEGVIQVGGSFLPRTPGKVEGIAVGRAFSTLHILHTTGWGDSAPAVWEGTVIGRYVLHYEDGSIENVPIVYGKDVRDWWAARASEGITRGALDLRVAWTGSNALTEQNNALVRLFLTTWINPAPEKKVLRIDCTSRKHLPTAPICVAMTLQGKSDDDITFLDLQPCANRKLTDDFHLDPMEQPAVPPPARIYVDEDHGFSVAAPANWLRWNPAQTAVPGEICRAWSRDGWTGIYISVQKSEQGITAEAILNARALAAAVDLGAEVHKRQLRTVAGMQAAYLAYSGRGSAFGVDGRGDAFPTQHWVAVPRERSIIHLILITPEIHSELAEEVFEAMLKTLRLDQS